MATFAGICGDVCRSGCDIYRADRDVYGAFVNLELVKMGRLRVRRDVCGDLNV